jgi:hypothetical protein
MMFRFYKQICVFVFSFFFINLIIAQEQRALLIGINHYEPPSDYKSKKVNIREFGNLDGCVNDTRSIKTIIQSYYGFKKDNIDSLIDEAASRAAIFSAMQKLLDNSKPGDVAFIYYSGHGSYVNNSFTMKLEKKDQTIVPSDSWKEGVHDIRDKELSAIFNAFLDKKVKLTTIFDCCNNGSISRGPSNTNIKARFLESEDWDSMDSSRHAIPENRGGDNFLIFSASRSFEKAEEYTENDIAQGAFTSALIKAINQQSSDATSSSIFEATRAILKNYGKPQEPVIGGSINRLNQTLFGIEKGGYQGDRAFPIFSVDAENNQIIIQAGFAMQVAKNAEFSRIDKNKNLYTIRVDSVLDLTQCLGSVIKGEIKEVHPGQLFNMTKNASSDFSSLKVWIPVSTVSNKQLDLYLNEIKLLKQSSRIKWMENFSDANSTAFTSVFYQDNKWFIKHGNNKAILMQKFGAKEILESCKNNKDSTVYIELPILGSFGKHLYDTLLSQSIPNLELVNAYEKSQYCLYGKMDNNGNATYGFRRTNLNLSDSLDPMPIRSDCFPIKMGNNLENYSSDTSLANRLKSLSKINYWLTLALPVDANRFIYHLEIFNEDLGRTIENNKYHLKDRISVKMVLNDSLKVDANAFHIYIFVLDGNGQFGCIYSDESVNSFPKSGDLYQSKEFIMVAPFQVTEPLGVDTYFLLASSEPFSNLCSLITKDAVLHQGSNEKGASRKQYIQKLSIQCLK